MCLLRSPRRVLIRSVSQTANRPQTNQPNRAAPRVGRTASVSESTSDSSATGADAGSENGEMLATQIPTCR